MCIKCGWEPRREHRRELSESVRGLNFPFHTQLLLSMKTLFCVRRKTWSKNFPHYLLWLLLLCAEVLYKWNMQFVKIMLFLLVEWYLSILNNSIMHMRILLTLQVKKIPLEHVSRLADVSVKPPQKVQKDQTEDGSCLHQSRK